MSAIATDAQCPVLVRGVRLQWEDVQGCHVLLFPEGMVTLSETAHDILRLCDGRTRSEIVAVLQAHYPDAELEQDVLEFLEIARDERWLEFR